VSHKEKAISQAEMDLRQQGSRRIAGSTQKFLKHYAPFDKMKGDALQLFAEKAQLAFHAADSEIVGPDSGTVRFFYVVESGKVQARQAGEVTVTEYSVLNLGPGESFPLGAATSGRPTTNTYTAVEDTFCYQLPTQDLMKLMAISRRGSSCSSSLPSVPASNRRSIRR
jgi:CBS domain-containing protein